MRTQDFRSDPSSILELYTVRFFIDFVIFCLVGALLAFQYCSSKLGCMQCPFPMPLCVCVCVCLFVNCWQRVAFPFTWNPHICWLKRQAHTSNSSSVIMMRYLSHMSVNVYYDEGLTHLSLRTYQVWVAFCYAVLLQYYIFVRSLPNKWRSLVSAAIQSTSLLLHALKQADQMLHNAAVCGQAPAPRQSHLVASSFQKSSRLHWVVLLPEN